MKYSESVIAQGRSIALAILDSTSQSELDRILELGLPESAFLRAITQSPLVPVRNIFLPYCKLQQEVGLSGLSPRVYLSSELSDVEAAASVSYGLFEMARAICLGKVSGADYGDLDVWLNAGLPATVKVVPPRFLEAYGNDKTMFRIELGGRDTALCSFTSLKRLVLLDG